MAKKVIVNEQGKLQWRDIAKSWMLLVLFPAIQAALDLLSKEAEVDWLNILRATGLATALFLIQRISEPAKVITTYQTNEHANAVADDIKKA